MEKEVMSMVPANCDYIEDSYLCNEKAHACVIWSSLVVLNEGMARMNVCRKHLGDTVARLISLHIPVMVTSPKMVANEDHDLMDADCGG